uniref:Uncharacterized protein n=1 Tax=Megaselia scalaris TaxID=36166 RepID=T1GRJ8_MEGSC
MLNWIFSILFLWFIFSHSNGQPSRINEDISSAMEANALSFLSEVDTKLKSIRNIEYNAAYDYNINITEKNRIKMIAIKTENCKYVKEVAQMIKSILSTLSLDALEEEDYNTLMNAISKMKSNYAKVKVCSYEDKTICNMALEPEIQERITNSRNPDELAYYWKEWYDHSGLPSRENFRTYVELTRKASKLNSLKSYADDWINKYDDKDFEANVDSIYNEILPFYKELHTC